MRLLGSQPQQIATPPSASIYNSNQQPSLYNSSASNGTTIGGLQSGSGVGGGFASLANSLGYSNSSCSLGTIGSPAALGSGTVTASPSPLGLTSGSLTPPPTLGGSSGSLQLGTLGVGTGRGVLSAAPGAEAAKFRNGVGVAGLAANGVFGSTNSLFTKLGSSNRGAAGVTPGVDKPPGRSRLLEDFRYYFENFLKFNDF
ncbi:pumilio homolog 2-like [Schistocerca serialis cubense]|uniref:pumilio homolog 2-like n=1 Tax=Schistocerca serialis cubense TaxID=2023355 RepID=UPI00214EB9BD|nr:pumilio homolog 2-like [Schistocerca serialis cubense]